MNLSRLSAREIEMRARELESQIKRLEHRPRPTPSERMLATQLKKERLAAKDLLLEATQTSPASHAKRRS